HTNVDGAQFAIDTYTVELFASMMPSLTSQAEAAEKMKAAGAKLLDQIGPAILLTHSQSGQYGWALADTRPSNVKAIVALEPAGPPFTNAVFPSTTSARQYGLTDIPVTYDPPINSPDDITRVVVSSEPLYTCFLQASPPRKLINLAHTGPFHSIHRWCDA
ncbi:hypothetical protein H0H81_010508, partial [Sphagnurus paluster]